MALPLQTRPPTFLLAASLVTWLLAGAVTPAAGRADDAPTRSEHHPRVPGLGARVSAGSSHGSFHGWRAVILRNATVEAIIVPALTRVMRFDLRGGGGTVEKVAGNQAGRGPFWNHPDLAQAPRPDGDGWTNYGGDKAWPAPQSEWAKITGRGWPPPRAFDALPSTSSVRAAPGGAQVDMVSAIDPQYGIRVRRTISLHPREPVMTIDTTYQKVRGGAARVAVWTITQLASPARLFVLLPDDGQAPPYTSLLPDPPRDLKVEGRLLSLSRDPFKKTMLSSSGQALLWVGAGPDLLIQDQTSAGMRTRARTGDGGTNPWPNDGARSQIYTAPGAETDGASYVELELLGRLHDLTVGQAARTRTTYTLIPRTHDDPDAEARAVFARVDAAAEPRR